MGLGAKFCITGGGRTCGSGIALICISGICISGISGMKVQRFCAGSLFIERVRMREGPPVVYICKSGPTAMSFTDTKKLLAFIRWPKSTPTGQLIREWLAGFTSETAPQDQSTSGTQAKPL